MGKKSLLKTNPAPVGGLVPKVLGNHNSHNKIAVQQYYVSTTSLNSILSSSLCVFVDRSRPALFYLRDVRVGRASKYNLRLGRWFQIYKDRGVKYCAVLVNFQKHRIF